MTAFAETFVFGLANSLHCAGMCGPLAACAPGGWSGATLYQGARVAGYVAAGVAAGSLGASMGESAPAAPWIPFVLSAGLVLMAVGVPRRWTAFATQLGPLRRWLGWASRCAPSTRALALGAVTPLLPCGLLYAVYGSAFLAGSGAGGATVMFGFALGSLPVLVAAQTQLGFIRAWLGAGRTRALHRAVMIAAAVILAWRGWVGLAAGSCH